MARLVINPDTPTPREIQLKPGTNRLGRAAGNDFTITDLSVSGTHCEIQVSDHAVVLRDLGSTNGTYVDRMRVQEAVLRAGQTIHLGGVAMLFQADAVAPAAPTGVRPTSPIAVAVPTAAPVARAAVPVATVRPALAVASPSAVPPPTAAAPAIAVVATATVRPAPAVAPPSAVPPPVALVPPVATAVGAAGLGPQNCRFHPKNPARYYCEHCRQFFCEMCVNARTTGGAAHKFCRHCGAECAAVQVQVARAASPEGFFRRLPGAFIYPFRGMGVFILILSTIVLSIVQYAMSNWMYILLAVAAFGYLFSYMQNILHATANEEKEMPELPGFDDVFGGALRLAGTTVISFGALIVLIVLKAFLDMDIPAAAIISTVLLGCLYFPMAFLAVAMKDTLLAANPLIVIPAILKVPLGYLVTTVITIGVYAIRQVGDAILAMVKAQTTFTKSMSELFVTYGLRALWSLISVYLLVVSMRVLGLLYVTNKQKFGWFNR